MQQELSMGNHTIFRIIVIDDNPEIHTDFKKILTSPSPIVELDVLRKKLLGETAATKGNEKICLPTFQLDSAMQGKQGVEKIAKAIKQKKPYALAFVDIRMPPGWDGIETIKNIWALDKDMQIVICTAYSDYSWEETLAELGPHDNLLILKKPFDQIAIRQLAFSLTQKWQLMQEARDYTNSLEKNIQKRTRSLQHSLSVTRATLDSSMEGLLVVGMDGKITDFNDKLISMWHIPKDIMDKKDFSLLINIILNQLANAKQLSGESNSILTNTEKTKTTTLDLKDGRIIECYKQPHTLAGRAIGYIWSFRDMTQRAHLENELKYQATHDGLTGLPNRALLKERIQQKIISSQQDGSSFAILFFDLDRFKLVNDSLSHAAGDALLCTLAERLQKSIRASDTLARQGGDEFVILILNLYDEKIIKDVAINLLDNINKPFNIEGHELFITASIGISLFPKDGKTVDELLQNADAAMYYAKENGANQIQFYNKKMNKEGIKRLELETDLRKAIQNNEFFLIYQPQIDLKTDKLIAVEALIRWQHPQKGIMLPIEFIPLAEDTGLIIPIGEWILRTACKQNKLWQEKGFPPIRIAVNVTTQQLRQIDFSKTIKNILKKIDLDPKYLEIELTENTVINNVEIINIIAKLKEIGVQVALDDFGTGYSSISYLKNLQLDRLKIDRSFIKNIEINRDDEAIIHAIIAMAHSLNVEVLAEGVETQSQLNFLKQRECSEIQGFYFSKPLLNTQLEAFFKGASKIKHLLIKKTE